MGFTYQELKNNEKNSIVLEKYKNIEIEKNSLGFSRTKRTFVREKFVCKPQKKGAKYPNQAERESSKPEFPKVSVDRVLKHTLVLEGAKQENFDKRIHKTSCQLTNLEQTINHEIEKLRKNNIFSSQSSESAPCKKHREEKQDATWAEHLAGNSRKERKPGIAKERFSLQHQCVCTSPRYNNNEDLAPRPRMRSVGSQMTTRGLTSAHGTNGDYTRWKKERKERNARNISKDFAKTDRSVITASQEKVHRLKEPPTCQQPVFSRTVNGTFCHRHDDEESGASADRECSHWHEEYYYDSGSLNCKRLWPPYTKAAPSTKHNRRQITDLDNEHVWRQSTHRSCSPKCRSNKISKTKIKEISGKNQKSYNKQPIEHKTKRDCEKLRERATRELTEVTAKHPTKENKPYNFFSVDEASKISQYFDRYIDEREEELKAEECRVLQVSDNCPPSTTTVTLRRATTFQQKSGRAHKEWLESCNDVPLYSVQTLEMLKKMKIREYKPINTKNNKHDNIQRPQHIKYDKRQEKLENYLKYLKKYENEVKAEFSIKVLKEPTKMQESEESDLNKKPAQNEQISTESDVRGNRVEKVICCQQDNSTPFEKHTRNVLYVEENSTNSQRSQSLERLIFVYGQAKRNVKDSHNNEDLRNHPYHSNLEDFSGVIKADEKYQTEDHKEYEKIKPIGTKDPILSNQKTVNKEENTALQNLSYDLNKVKERQAQGRHVIESQDRYENTTLGKTKTGANSAQEVEHASKDNNPDIKTSPGYEADIFREFRHHKQHPVCESVRKMFGDHESVTEYKSVADMDCGMENGETVNDAKNKKKLDNHTDVHRPSQNEHKTPGEILETPYKADLPLETDKEDLDFPESARTKRSTIESLRETKLSEEKDQCESLKELKGETQTEHLPQYEINRVDSINNIQTKQNLHDQSDMYGPLKDQQLKEALNKGYKQQLLEQTHSAVKTLQQKEDEQTKLRSFSDKKKEALNPKESQLCAVEQANNNFTLDNPANKFDVKQNKFHSSTYDDFKKVLDHNLGIYTQRSSQTESNFKTDLSDQMSKQTFTQEYPRHNIANTTEDALKYLKNFLKSYQQSGIEETCLSPVTSAANDLITKLSSCKNLPPTPVLTSQDDFKDKQQSSQDHSTNILQVKSVPDLLFKNPESTPDSSDAHLKEVESSLYVTEMSENKPEINQLEDSIASNENDKQDLVPSPNLLKDLGPADVDKDFFEQEIYQRQTQINSKHWQTSETYQNYQECKEELNSPTAAEEFDHLPSLHAVNSEDPYFEPDMKTHDPYGVMAGYSKLSVFDPELMPLKGILKSNRLLLNAQGPVCDLAPYKNSSVTSCGQDDRINLQQTSSIIYWAAEERKAQHINGHMDTVITKDECHLPLAMQSNLRLSKNEQAKQPIYQDYQPETESVLESCHSNNYYYPTSTIEMPAFQQCPCMWNTYVKMMKNYYEGRRKQIGQF